MLKVREVYKNNQHALTEETAKIGMPDIKEYGILVIQKFKEMDPDQPL